MTSHKLSKNQIADSCKLYKEGVSRAELAEKHQVTEGAIVYHLKKSKLLETYRIPRGKLSRSDRAFKCDCGHTEDRDVNAAQNLRTLGFRGIDACGQAGSGPGLCQDDTGLGETGTQSLATSTSCHI